MKSVSNCLCNNKNLFTISLACLECEIYSLYIFVSFKFAGNLFNKDPVEVEAPAVTAEPVEEPAAEEE